MKGLTLVLRTLAGNVFNPVFDDFWLEVAGFPDFDVAHILASAFQQFSMGPYPVKFKNTKDQIGFRRLEICEIRISRKNRPAPLEVLHNGRHFL